MAEDQVPRRRRRRRRRRTGASEAAVTPQEPAASRPATGGPEPQWLTVPVFFAFFLGVVVMGLSIGAPLFSIVLFFLGLAGVAFTLARLPTRRFLARRR